MAGPTTAALDDDIKELKTSIQRIVDAVHSQEVTMTQRFDRLDSRVDLLAGRVDTYAAISKWAAGIVVALLIAILGSVGASIWWAARIDYRIGQLEQPTKVEAPKRP